jgi:hypothetical protein
MDSTLLGQRRPDDRDGESGLTLQDEVPSCPHIRGSITRRRFLAWGGRGVVAATALFGGVVGFRPTPAHAVDCAYWTVNIISCSECNVAGCIGMCVPAPQYSCCTYFYGSEYNDETCCQCPGTPENCDPGWYRAVADCPNEGYCFTCCSYC